MGDRQDGVGLGEVESPSLALEPGLAGQDAHGRAAEESGDEPARGAVVDVRREPAVTAAAENASVAATRPIMRGTKDMVVAPRSV